jgi:hypothetical protein
MLEFNNIHTNNYIFFIINHKNLTKDEKNDILDEYRDYLISIKKWKKIKTDFDNC